MPRTLKERVDKHEERLDKHDRQIAAIRNLIQEGMRLVIVTRKEIRELVAAQKRTEESLKELINTMKHGGSGHVKSRVYVQ